MAYEKTEWKDQDVENPRTYSVRQNLDGTITLLDAFGEVREIGTPVNAENLNKMEQGIYDAQRVVGDIGDIYYTLRTDVPAGGAWCDGAEYTKEAFPAVYQMLVDGKLQKTDYETYNSSVSINGSCGFFALDTGTQKFKVPLLKDIYIKAGDAPLMFGAESLPNITGDGLCIANNPKGAIKNPSNVLGYTSTSGNTIRACTSLNIDERTFDASLSSSTYQDEAKVNPDHVVYRAYVVLYTGAVSASVAQAQEFMTALGGKANVGLDNITAEAKEVITNLNSPTIGYIDLDLQFNQESTNVFVAHTVAPANGYFHFFHQAPSSKDSGFSIQSEDSEFMVNSISPANGGASINLRTSKNERVKFTYLNGRGSTYIYRFFYLKGSKE